MTEQSGTTTCVPETLTLQEGLPFEEMEHRIGLAYAAAGLRHRVAAFYLADVDARNLHQAAGFQSTVRYAMTRFDMSRREARELLAAGKALHDLPLTDDAFAEGRLCWSKVRELVKVSSPRHEDRWLELAMRTPIEQLALEVKLAKPGEPPRDHDDRKGLPEVRLRLNTSMPPDVYAKWEQVRQKIQDESGGPLEEWECLEALIDLGLAFDDDGSLDGRTRTGDSCYCTPVHTDTNAVETRDGDLPVAPETAETLACEADHHVSPSLRRKVLARDGHRCRCCRGRHRLQVHHVVWFSRGGRTNMANLVTLCRGCHTRVHARLLVIAGSDEEGWRFEDKDGNDLNGRAATPAELLGGRRFIETARPIRASAKQVPLRLEEVPDVIEPEWWRLHGHLVRWSESDGAFKLRVGLPRESAAMPTRVAQCATRLDNLVGQGAVIRALRVSLTAARKLGEPFGHTLLTGPPGLGKTTLAHALAGELGTRCAESNGSQLKNPQLLLHLLGALGEGDVLFIDEIHTMPRAVCEVLYQAMTAQKLSIVLVSDTGVRTVKLRVPSFTLIGATTDHGLLPTPFVSRFVHREHLDFYSPTELTELILRSEQRGDLNIGADVARELAEVSRESPREALRLLRRVGDEAVATDRARIDMATMARTLDELGIDGRGLGPVDRAYLDLLRSRGKHPIGLARAAEILGLCPTTLERVYEPYLLRLGLIRTTPAGRVAQ